jgi:hypothetical protein
MRGQNKRRSSDVNGKERKRLNDYPRQVTACGGTSSSTLVRNLFVTF